MVDFSDTNETEIIKLLNAISIELQKINESIATMEKNNIEKINEIITKIEAVEHSVDTIGPLEVYGDFS